jgi:hypothetical protein
MTRSDTETLERRRLLTLVGGTALTLPLAGCASPGEGEGGEGEEGGEGGEDEEESLDGDAVVVTGPEQSSSPLLLLVLYSISNRTLSLTASASSKSPPPRRPRAAFFPHSTAGWVNVETVSSSP